MALIGNILFRKNFKNVFTLWNRRMRNYSSSPAHCKVAIITGGATGIGLAFAKSLLECGAKGVMLGGRREDIGKKAVDILNEEYGEKKASFLKTDVTKQDDFEDLFKCAIQKYKYVDLVINNAGILNDKHWELTVNINAIGLVRGTLLGFKYMGQNNNGKGGTIVNVSSIYGLQAAHGCPVYCATKHFIIGFSRCVSNEYYENLTGVKVFTICPGVTDTVMITDASKYALENFGDVGTILKDELASLPSQPTEACGDCLMQILCADENGSIWVIEDSQCYKVKLPDRHTLRECDE